MTRPRPALAIAATLLAATGSMIATTTVPAAPAAAAETQQQSVTLTAEQNDNARTIIAVGKGANLSGHAQVIAIATAMQESSLQNLDYGDSDSLGLFQQRPSMGWGTAEQIKDPVLASKAFYGIAQHTSNPGLTSVADYETMPVAEAAQAVQRSAYPDAYAKWEQLAMDTIGANGDVAPIG